MDRAYTSERNRQHCKSGHPLDTRGKAERGRPKKTLQRTEDEGEIQKWARYREEWKEFFAALCAKRRYGHKTKADRCVTSFPSVRRKSSKRWNCKSSAVGITYCKSAMGEKFCHGRPKQSDLVDGFLSISKCLIHSPSPFPAI